MGMVDCEGCGRELYGWLTLCPWCNRRRWPTEDAPFRGSPVEVAVVWQQPARSSVVEVAAGVFFGLVAFAVAGAVFWFVVLSVLLG